AKAVRLSIMMGKPIASSYITIMSSSRAVSFFSVPFALLPATQMPKRIHHSSWGLVIRFGKLVGSTPTIGVVAILNLDACPINSRVEKHFEFEASAGGDGLYLDLSMIPKCPNFLFGNKNLPAAIDSPTELADE